MAPTEIDIVLRSIEVLRDEMRIAIKELRDDQRTSHTDLRDDVTNKLTDHDRRLRDLEEAAAKDEAVDGYKDTQRKRAAEEHRWRIGIAVTLVGLLATSFVTLLKLAGVL